jgi:hypothetical protein
MDSDMPIRSLFALSLSLTLTCIATAAEPCVSGLNVGARPGPYSFLVASGSERGQQTCYVCETAEKPGVIVFARSTSAPLSKLLVKCDEIIATQPKDSMRAWMTMLGEKTIGMDDLGKWSKQNGLKTLPVGIFDDPIGPPSYKLADEADVTVVVFSKRKVIGNFAYRAGELSDKDIEKISTSIKSIISTK